MKYSINPASLALIAGTLATTGLVVSCGGSSGSSTTSPPVSAKAATIDMTSVATGIPEASAFLPICTTGVSTKSLAGSYNQALASWLPKVVDVKGARQAQSGALALKAFTSSKPADSLGTCGGRKTYSSYSHLSGVTTATVAYENYCSSDSGTGNKSIINGAYSFVDTGTPTASGPITTKVEANSPAGVSFITQDSTGKVLSSQLFAFTNYVYAPGVPGGTATAAKPDAYTIADLSITDKLTSKTYRQTNYSVSSFETASGGEQMTMSGRSYRSGGDYFDMSTTVPMLTNSSGDTVSGELTFTGDAGSKAVATLVPGSTFQATMKVNGTTVSAVPVCK